MKVHEYTEFDGLGLADLVRRKEVTPEELAQTALSAIDSVNSKINAVVAAYPERAEALPRDPRENGKLEGAPHRAWPSGLRRRRP